nr:hypothetical protein [Tanacetum cinerariifolium]
MPVFFDSTIIHSESASRHEASVASTAEADLGISAPNDSVSKKQDKTKLAEDVLETTHTKTCSKNDSKADKEVSFGDDEFNTSPDLFSSNDATKEIKRKDMSKLV